MRKIKKHKKKISAPHLSEDSPPVDYYHAGIMLFNNQHYDEAIIQFRKALELNPGLIHAYNYIGIALQEKKQFDDAIPFYQKAVQLNPADPTAYINLGIVFHNIRQHEKAIEYFQCALQRNPNLHQAYDYMGLSFALEGNVEKAIESYRSSLLINPASQMTLINLGNMLAKQGNPEDAEKCLRRVLQINPGNLDAAQSLLYNVFYDTRYDAQAIFSEHLRFSTRFAEPLSVFGAPHTNERSVMRKLKIGYVSGDFKRHSVAYFIEPVLSAHNREHFEVFCYSNVDTGDDVTERLKNSADQWKDLSILSDNDAVELIRKDGIDILVDLSGHTHNNRILLFAYKPAPVQVSWIGYPATTGLSSIDYKIVDSHTDPPPATEQFYTEKLIRLPGCFLCYSPEKDSPEINGPPARTEGYVTFGSFNNFSKVSPEMIALWTEILSLVPRSRILMKSAIFSDGTTCKYVMDLFHQKGIDAQRIGLLPWEPIVSKHLGTYHRIDIALDTFPYNGTTTTCEALWMGVPVIVLEGNTHVSRVGASLLSNVGLPELIAGTTDEYKSIAVNLAGDLERLKSLRGNLRTMMELSPLCNAKRFTANLEMCYRRMWETWCKTA